MHAPVTLATAVAVRHADAADTAGTIALTVAMPTDQPITSVTTTPIPDWTATTKPAPLAPPVQADGETLTKVVVSVTWTPSPSGPRRESC